MMPINKTKEVSFTIVTPSFNQGEYIEQTILSVISQEGDFSIQYIIADGGSTDQTLATIKKYDDLLKHNLYGIKCKNITLQYWSKKDNGQANALNEGFAMAQGTLLGWINSDDFYETKALQKVADAFRKEPTTDIVYGNGYTLLNSTKVTIPITPPKINYRSLLMRGCEIFQPSTFFTKTCFTHVGGIDETLNYAFDYDLWLKILRRGKISYLNEYLSYFRLWPQSKTSRTAQKFIEEEKIILKRHTIGFPGPYHFFILKRVLKKIIFYETIKKLFSSSRYISE